MPKLSHEIYYFRALIRLILEGGKTLSTFFFVLLSIQINQDHDNHLTNQPSPPY